MAAAGALDRLVLVGVNHRTAPLDLRERLAPAEAEVAMLLPGLLPSGLDEAALLATCDRIELVGMEAAPDGALSAFRQLAGRAGVELPPAGLYRHAGAAALDHLFRVASALDSQIVGEPQILGQVKLAHRAALEAGTLGPELASIFAAAFGTAKRVRNETALGERPVSLAAAAVQALRDLHGELSDLDGLLLGGGEVGEFLAQAFRTAGLKRLTVMARVPHQAAETAARFGVHHAPIDRLPDELARADLVLAALGTGRIYIDAAMVTAALRRRRQRPIFLIDTALPGDVAAEVGAIDQAFLYTVEDLERLALSGRAQRAAAAAPAQAIVEAAVESYLRVRAERAAVPTLVALRTHFEAVRQQVLAAASGADAEAATRLLVNRLLHGPSAWLRAAGEDAAAERVVRGLFGLDGEDEEKQG